jgi:hypothetical protein
MEHIGILTVIALILATYRLTKLVTVDEVPFGAIRRKIEGSGSKLEYLMSCPFCVSVWVGGFLSVGQGLISDWSPWLMFVSAMALSATTCLLASLAPHSFD